MAQRLVLDGRVAWRKRFRDTPPLRRAATRAWNALAAWLDVRPLATPVNLDACEAMQTERRRLDELRAAGVRVPSVLEARGDSILIADIGASLSSRLKQSKDADESARLVSAAGAALAEVHARDAYLGQPLARNIAVAANEEIGFLDFEEDPRRLMSLHDAQARDWVLFALGVAAFFPRCEEGLAALLAHPLERAPVAVTGEVRRITRRLSGLPRLVRPFGARARAIGTAIYALRRALGILVLFVVLLDCVTDGELDLFNLLQDSLS